MEVDRLHSGTSGGTFRLLDLPAEIVLAICNVSIPGNGPFITFTDHEELVRGFGDLARLARTCKALAQIVRLFFRDRKGQEKFIGIFPYARNILQNPELARRETTLRAVSSNMYGLIGEGDLEIFAAASRAQGTSSTSINHHLRNYVRDGDFQKFSPWNLYVVRSRVTHILLANLPNLTSITVDCGIWFREQQQTLRPMSRPVLRSLDLPFVKRARFIGLRFQDRYYYITNSNLSASFHEYIDAAPNLEVLELEGMKTCSNGLNLPNVRSISITNSCMKATCMEALLNSHGLCLENFTYITGLYDNYVRKQVVKRGEEIFPGDLIKSLMNSTARTHLKTLKLDFRERGDYSKRFTSIKNLDWWYQFHDHNATTHFITTLSDFWSLRHVTLTQQCLWEWYYNWATGFKADMTPRSPSRLIDLLPESIETFTLVDTTLEFFPAIITLAAVVNSKQRFPNLKRVHLRPHPDLIRQHAHAKAHADDPSLPMGISDDMQCIINSQIEPQRALMVRLFQYVGVEVDFPMEVYPISTDDRKDLERQRHLGHWCRKCHFHGNYFVPNTRLPVQQLMKSKQGIPLSE
ncbi:hypothetical protein F4805DRAFT_463139 [Annulohypoxylon moriforme]|nr:hypothetical protein F4805DRAFT_463139 [Annulohypoxylon moriforme]